jgi:hypothetical protein
MTSSHLAFCRSPFRFATRTGGPEIQPILCKNWSIIEVESRPFSSRPLVQRL